METVESAGLLKKAVDLFFKGLNSMFEDIMKDSEAFEKEGKLGNIITLGLEDHPEGMVLVRLYPVQGKKDTFYIEQVVGAGLDKDGNKIKLDRWKPTTIEGEEEIKNQLNKFIEDSGYGQLGKPDSNEQKDDEAESQEESEQPEDLVDEQEETTESSTRIQVKLQHVKGSTDVEYTAINATCDPDVAMDMLCDVIESDEFELGEEPLMLEISDNGDSIDVAEIESVNCDDVPMKVFCAAVSLSDDAHQIQIACPTTYIDVYQIDTMVDEVAKICVRMCNIYPNRGCVSCASENLTAPLSENDAKQQMLSKLQAFNSTLEMYLVDFGPGDQQLIQNWMIALNDMMYRLQASNIPTPEVAVVEQVTNESL